MKRICFKGRNLLATALLDKWTSNAGPLRNLVPLAHARPNFKLYCFSLKKTDMLKPWPLQICFAVGFRVSTNHTTLSCHDAVCDKDTASF